MSASEGKAAPPRPVRRRSRRSASATRVALLAGSLSLFLSLVATMALASPPGADGQPLPSAPAAPPGTEATTPDLDPAPPVVVRRIHRRHYVVTDQAAAGAPPPQTSSRPPAAASPASPGSHVAPAAPPQPPPPPPPAPAPAPDATSGASR